MTRPVPHPDILRNAGSETDPRQNFATAGITPVARPGFVSRAFMAVVAGAERLNLRFARIGNPPVDDNAAFPWVAGLESQAPRIQAELRAVLRRQSDLPSFHGISTDVRTRPSRDIAKRAAAAK